VRPVIDEAREIEWHCLTDLDSLTTAIDELDDLLGRLSTLEPDQLSQLEFTSIYNQLSVATLNGFALLAAGGGECRMETPYVPVQTVIGSDGQGHVCCYGHTIEHCVPPSE
jgi:hypothetical protein